jgi:hypothetical protein
LCRDTRRGPSILFCSVSSINDFFEYPICIGPLAIRYVEGFCDFGGCLTPERRTPDNVDFLFDTKPDSSFVDNIGPALSGDTAHIAQFQIMRAVCGNVSQWVLDDCSIRCQITVLVRTNRPELLRNYLSGLCAVASALTAGPGCKCLVDKIWGGLTVAAFVTVPSTRTLDLASRARIT